MSTEIEQLDDHIDYIEFAVSDIRRSKVFYADAFGWTYTDYGEEYCEFTDSRIKGGFHSMEPPKTGGPLIVLYHSDLEASLEKVRAAGGTITREIFSFPGGERFQFRDPDGYELAVWRKT
jgi:hypothetical protein